MAASAQSAPKKSKIKIIMWGLVAFIVLSALFSSCGDEGAESVATPAPVTETETETETEEAIPVPEPRVVEEPEPVVEEPDPVVEEPEFSVSQENALKKAESYLSFMAFSRSGLIDQLEFEGYSNADATWAADQVGADWNEQAALKASSYLDTMSFSRAGLVDQLLFEGFTPEQAEYGVSQTGL